MQFLTGYSPSMRRRRHQWFLALQDDIASLARFSERRQLPPENTMFPFEVHLLYATLRIGIGSCLRLRKMRSTDEA
jgi:hypothetical protein